MLKPVLHDFAPVFTLFDQMKFVAVVKRLSICTSSVRLQSLSYGFVCKVTMKQKKNSKHTATANRFHNAIENHSVTFLEVSFGKETKRKLNELKFSAIKKGTERENRENKMKIKYERGTELKSGTKTWKRKRVRNGERGIRYEIKKLVFRAYHFRGRGSAQPSTTCSPEKVRKARP